MAKQGFIGEAHKNVSGKQNGQAGGVLCIIEIQILLEALEASIGQIASLWRSFSDVSKTEQRIEH